MEAARRRYNRDMSDEAKLWRIEGGDNLRVMPQSPLDLEIRIQRWLERDISILTPGLLVIGKEVETEFGGFIDLLCLDRVGDLVVVELKRDKTPREITAQTLDYGSWVSELSNEDVTAIAEKYLGQGKFEEAFKLRFGDVVPETLNERHRLMIVASHIDASSERIIKYLSGTYGVNINAATFQYFQEQDGSEFLARVFLIEPAQVELQGRIHNPGKRQPNLTYGELEAQADANAVGEYMATE